VSILRLTSLLVSTIALAAPALATEGVVVLPRLGLEVTDVSPTLAAQAGLDQVKGCFVRAVAAGSPAEAGGVQLGDIIVSLNNRGIRDAKELKNDIAGIEPGEVISVCVVRDDYRTTLHITLGEAPAEQVKVPGWLGTEVSNVKGGSLESALLEQAGKEGGIVVDRVVPGSPAEQVGIERGDVIMSFNSRKVRTVKELAADLAGANPGDRVRICIMRGEIRKTLYPVLSAPPRAAVALTAGESGTEQERRLPSGSQLAALFPEASRVARQLTPVPHYRAYRSDELIGVAFVTTEVCPKESEGYQGPISVLVGLSTTGTIVGVTLLYHTESIKYTRDRLEQFIAQYKDKNATDPFAFGEDIDAITGATVTSSTINRSIELGSSIVMAEVLHAKRRSTASRARGWSSVVWNIDVVLLLAMAALALAGYLRGSQTVRFLVLGMALLYLGYLKGGGLSIHDAINLLERHLPALSTNVYWYMLVFFVGLTAIFIGRFYCGWFCPFGALTEMLYRALPQLKVTLPFRVDQALRLLKYLLLMVILLGLVYAGQAHLTAWIEVVEPFGTLFRMHGSLLSWVMVGVFIVGSVFVSRAYCRYICPLGALFALITIGVSFVKRALLRIEPAPRHRESAAAVGGCPVGAIPHETHSMDIGIRSGECIVCAPPWRAGEASRERRPGSPPSPR
jgi:NosR/NirI family nitrous oxide reductase transcriptional regulator